MNEHTISNQPTPRRRKRLPGGQPGNRNGLKHGLYSTQLTAQERRMFLQARKMRGVGDELAVFRVKFAQMLSDPWLNLRSLALALSVVTRAEALQHKMYAPQEEKEKLGDNLANVLTSVGRAMGFEDEYFQEEDEDYEDNRDSGGSTLIHYGYGPDRYDDPQFDVYRVEGGFPPIGYGQGSEFAPYQYDAVADGGGYEGGDDGGHFYRPQDDGGEGGDAPGDAGDEHGDGAALDHVGDGLRRSSGQASPGSGTVESDGGSGGGELDRGDEFGGGTIGWGRAPP